MHSFGYRPNALLTFALTILAVMCCFASLSDNFSVPTIADIKERKTSMGKQKIEIKKIEAEDARQVCFSKRKYGIFSKANELATLCGSKVAILIESPGGRPYSFGSPSIAHVTDMFLHGGTGSTEVDVNEGQRLLKVQQLNNNLMDVGSNLQESKKKKAMLISRIAELSEHNEDVWRIENAEDLNLVELKKTKESLERFKEIIKTKMIKDTTANSEMVISPELGPRVNNIGPSHGKGFDLNLNLFPDESFDHVVQMNPYITPDANGAGPSEPYRVPDDNKVSYPTLVELDMLGGRGNIAVKEPK